MTKQQQHHQMLLTTENEAINSISLYSLTWHCVATEMHPCICGQSVKAIDGYTRKLAIQRVSPETEI